jgi:hypothetical protein
MTRVKGWIDTSTKIYALQPPYVNTRYVESIPADALRCENVVSKHGRDDRRKGMAYVLLPAHLIGKRVEVIIIVEE